MYCLRCHKENPIFGQMKVLAVILATYMALLTIQPVVQQISFGPMHQMHKGCCHKCCHQTTNEESNTCCPTNACNPFQLCGCCFGFNTNTQTFNFNINPDAIGWLTAGHSKLISGYYPDNFQPPEMI
jgi:hypothetical protein